VNSSAPHARSPHYTALRCLFVVCLHRGVQLKPENFAEVKESDTLGSVLRVMQKVGLRGRVLPGCKWKKLTALGYAYPVMAQQKAGNWVVVLSAVKGPIRRSPSRSDVGEEWQRWFRADFVDGWSGALILCKRAQKLSDEGCRSACAGSCPNPASPGLFRDVATRRCRRSSPSYAADVPDPHRQGHHPPQLSDLDLADADLRRVDVVRRRLQLYAPLPLLFITIRSMAAGVAHVPSPPLSLRSRLQQAETIRQFLTGFQTMLDAMAPPLMLAILLLYSVKLTIVVLIPLVIAAIIAHGADLPPCLSSSMRRGQPAGPSGRDHPWHAHGQVDALEPVDERVTTRSHRASRSATAGRSRRCQRADPRPREDHADLGTRAGAMDVFDGTLSIGACRLQHDIRPRHRPLADRRPDQRVPGDRAGREDAGHGDAASAGARPCHVGISPGITGNIEFADVTFRYPTAASAVLDRVSFKVEEGQVIGIVGRSGSGKTTITRLIQGIQTAQEGLIRLDGIDIRHINLPHLRRSIGVVLQTFLFRGTVRENIAAARPDAPLAEVVEAARMAGAEEFIDRLPLSYDNLVEENGANFSGGQRQRIAIGRALMTRPRLLIFDEDQCLDPESEAIIQSTGEIAHGTLLIASHRLTSSPMPTPSLCSNGKVVDCAPHPVLLERCEPYQRLWRQQTSSLQ
jgi:ATP-binding cassette subfamily B protein